MNFNNLDDFSSSPYSVDSANSDDPDRTFMTAGEDGESSDSDDKDLVEDESITEIDGENATTRSNGSSSTGSSGKLDEALRQAARQAGTQGIDYDENGDITMEMVDEEVTVAFKPWTKKSGQAFEVVGNPSALQDQENINPFSPAFKAKVRSNAEENIEETMEFTQAVGTILPPGRKAFSRLEDSPQKARPSERRKSNMTRRRSSGASSSFSDETMDLTVAVGGIQQNQRKVATQQQVEKSHYDEEDEEMTMEFTSVFGGVLDRSARIISHESGSSLSNDEDMDFTVAGGGILPSITERTEPIEDETMGMDITKAIGAILPDQLRTSNHAQAKGIMERETDNGQLSGSSMYRGAQKTPEADPSADVRLSEHVRTVASETGSPSLIVTEGRASSRRATSWAKSVTPKAASRQFTPSNKPATPSKQCTPKVLKPVTPGKTPPPKSVSMRTGSPKKLFEAEIKQAITSSDVKANSASVREDSATGGVPTPSVVLKPRSRRSSGLGVDRIGIGSPRVTELLDGRGSICENAEMFIAQRQPQTNVRFADPQIVEQELDQERIKDQQRENGPNNLQREADDQDLENQKDATTNLKDMIESLTPQKKMRKLNGRKSLHVGAAKGLLGKRPPELNDDEDDEDSTPKRLKGREGSPVKKVKLPAPPPKNATTGRMTRSSRVSLGETEANARLSTPMGEASPNKNGRVISPKDQQRYKDAGIDVSPVKVALSLVSKTGLDAAAAVEPPEGEDRIHLQDFLNLTSIRFMELTTTKRRHTIAPNSSLDDNTKTLEAGADDATQSEADSELESCVVAGACTLPMLDLYQHVSTLRNCRTFWH